MMAQGNVRIDLYGYLKFKNIENKENFKPLPERKNKKSIRTIQQQMSQEQHWPHVTVQ